MPIVFFLLITDHQNTASSERTHVNPPFAHCRKSVIIYHKRDVIVIKARISNIVDQYSTIVDRIYIIYWDCRREIMLKLIWH